MAEIERHAEAIGDYVGICLSLQRKLSDARIYIESRRSLDSITEPGVVDNSPSKLSEGSGTPLFSLRTELDKAIGFMPYKIRIHPTISKLLYEAIFVVESV